MTIRNAIITSVMAVACVASSDVCAQPAAAPFPYDISYYMPVGIGDFDAAVPKPKDVLGFEIGQQHCDWGDIVKYMETLADNSPRVSIRTTGTTYQFRPFIEVVITSERNQSKLEELRANHLLLSDASKSGDLDIENMPCVVKFNYSIHGNESSAYNASIPVAYLFAASKDPMVRKILDDCIIIICPSANPDGSNRFATYVNTTRSNTDVSDLNSWEFSETWPVSRGNHYFADCNRDYLMVQHPEGINAVSTYLHWRPNIMTDQHEQGAARTFYFSPGEPSRVHPLIPEGNYEMTAGVSSNIAGEFDKIHSGYYSGEGYDNYYIGKGSAYGAMHGSICLLYEQGQTRGHLRNTSNGVRSFPWTVRNQAVASYATAISGMKMRKQLLEYQRKFYKDAEKENKSLETKGYVFNARGNKGLLYHFLKDMAIHKISVHSLSKDVEVDGRRYTAKDSYIIPVGQNESKMVRTVMDKMDHFEDSIFYDISAWTFPMAYNLDCSLLKSTTGLVGEKVECSAFEPGTVIGGKSDVGYIFGTGELYSHKVIFDLLGAGVYVNVSNNPITVETDGKKIKLGYGAVQVMASNQPVSSDSIYKIVSNAARQSGVAVYSLSSCTMPGLDFTSPSFSPVKLPKVAILANEGMGVTETGEAWFLLDRRFQMKPVMLKKTNLTDKILGNYNVIVMSNGIPALTKGSEEALKKWVADGGTLIAYGKSYGYLKSLGLLDVKTKKPATYADSASNTSFAKMKEEKVTNPISGVILNCNIDKTHPLCWGLDQKQIPVMKIRKGNLVYLRDPSANYLTPLRYTKNPRLSGHISVCNEKLIGNTPAVFVKPYKSGKVIFFADNPLFRSQWFGTTKLFMNAIFFAGQM